MAQPLTLAHILFELVLGFSSASVLVLAILRLAAVDFPLLAALQITFVWTLVVYAAMRAMGVLTIVANPTTETGSIVGYRKDGNLGKDTAGEIKT
ncbi:hypothetical protein C8R44DRAFT_758013, partial [Mycena epipterygia]